LETDAADQLVGEAAGGVEGVVVLWTEGGFGDGQLAQEGADEFGGCGAEVGGFVAKGHELVDYGVDIAGRLTFCEFCDFFVISEASLAGLYTSGVESLRLQETDDETDVWDRALVHRCDGTLCHCVERALWQQHDGTLGEDSEGALCQRWRIDGVGNVAG